MIFLRTADRNQTGMTGGGQTVPDWAKDWHASIASSGSVQAEVCSMYGEWLHLVQKTRGGFFYGTDPSYGGDLSGRNQRGASYSFYDNARYITLSKIFRAGICADRLSVTRSTQGERLGAPGYLKGLAPLIFCRTPDTTAQNARYLLRSASLGQTRHPASDLRHPHRSPARRPAESASASSPLSFLTPAPTPR